MNHPLNPFKIKRRIQIELSNNNKIEMLDLYNLVRKDKHTLNFSEKCLFFKILSEIKEEDLIKIEGGDVALLGVVIK